ncbi:MAG: tetratricopeptide repeat protein [Chloroflexota bacterium]|nr:MAG: tetratricopeptide repeat protein [Chloroflexota bacterium]
MRRFTILCTVNVLALLAVLLALGCQSLAARQINNRGMALANEGQWEEAISEFSEAIELYPDYAMAYNNRGWAYSELGQYDRAIIDYDKAIVLNPKLAVAYSNRGSAHKKKDELELAIADLNRAIKLDPELAAAYNNRGLIYSEIEQFDLAIADYNKVLELSNDPILVQLAQRKIRELESPVTSAKPSTKEPRVEIIIYTDLQCPMCYRLYSEVEPELVRRYVTTDKASLEIRLLSAVGPESSLAAEATACAAEQGQFWEYRDAIFKAWSQAGQAVYTEEELRKAAAELGLDEKTFSACLASGKWREAIAENLYAAGKAGIDEIPTVLISGVKIVGLKPLETYFEIIEEQLDR